MTIPEYVYHDGTTYSVVQIGEYAFDREYQGFGPSNDLLRSLTIPESVTTIKEYAFNNCSKLETINLPYNLTSIEEGVFSGCSSLTEINVPNPVKTIRSYAFRNCKALSNINIDTYCQLDSIEDYAFLNCTSLQKICLSKHLSYIRSYAIEGCSALTDIYIAQNRNYFSEDGILYTRENNGLLIYPAGIQDIEYITKDHLTLVDWFAFQQNKFIQKVIISPGVERIGTHAFYDCTSLSEVIIPETVNEIEYWAFSGCNSKDGYGSPHTKLHSLTLPASVEKLANFAVKGVPKLTVLNPEPPHFFERPGRSPGSIPEFSQIIICDTLFVPNASVEKYKAAKNIEFKHIFSVEPLSEIRFESENISLFESATDSLALITTPTHALCSPIEWFSSNPSVASVAPTGKITARQSGTTTVTAKCGDLTATCNIIVGKEPQSIRINTITAEIGSRVLLQSAITPSDALAPETTWISSDETIASVDDAGNVQFIGRGFASIKASCHGHTDSLHFEVVDVKTQSLKVFPSEATGKPGDCVYLLAIHEPVNATDKSIQWSSSDEDVATVDESGLVTFKSTGTANITAVNGLHSATCAVSVNNSTALRSTSADGFSIEYIDGGIRLLNLPDLAHVIISDITGITVTATIAQTNDITIPLTSGIYLVTVNNWTAKVLIR